MSFRQLSILALLGLTVLMGVLSAQGPSHTAEAGTFGTVTVTTAADTDVNEGLCSYREAIKAQNMNAGYNGCTGSSAGPDRIVFDLGSGAVITWLNDDNVDHTATDKNSAWDSTIIHSEESETLTLDTPGTYNYYCTIHPYMTGTLTVRTEGPPTSSSSPQPSP